MTRIDPTGNTRLSTNLSVERQTAKSDFGDKLQSGLNTATGALANGLAVAGNFVPGASILSAAVSSLNSMSSGVTSQYNSTGVVSLGSGSAGGGMSTTVGAGATSVGGLGSAGGTAGGVPTPGQFLGGTGMGGASLGSAGSGLSEQAAQLGQMLQVQMAVQRENQVFTTVSNVQKTRQDTVKNTISNVR